MDAAAHYRHLLQLGRVEFLATVAPAVLVRYRAEETELDAGGLGTVTLTLDEETVAEEVLPEAKLATAAVDFELYPLSKKPGASFPDRITIGRTPNNDVAIREHSVSRLHAYVRTDGDSWLIADAGSKNGSTLQGEVLEPRREKPLPSRAILRLGDVELTFFLATDLFTALGGS